MADDESVERALGALRDLLRAKDLKQSKVREAIARTALAYDGHFTVEELAQLLRERGVAGAHLATVYRAIPLLVEAGLIQPALVAQGDRQHYEAAFERAHHDHLVCLSCGSVVEFYSETLEVIQREIAERYGYRLEQHVHELRGLCTRCQRSPVTRGH